jgi:hypothetical protein
MIECAFNIYKEIGVKLDSELWYELVPKSVETSEDGKVHYYYGIITDII